MAKSVVYLVTLAAVLLLGLLELRLRDSFRERVRLEPEIPSEMSVVGGILRQVRAQSLLEGLPEREGRVLKRVVVAKFLCLGALILEIVLLQR